MRASNGIGMGSNLLVMASNVLVTSGGLQPNSDDGPDGVQPDTSVKCLIEPWQNCIFQNIDD